MASESSHFTSAASRDADNPSTVTPLQPRSSDSVEATLLGKTLGTAAYMSPEQAAGETDRLGPATDIYALGATLYHLLTGQPSQQDRDVGRAVERAARAEFVPPRSVNPTVPSPLQSICLKAMSLKPVDRYGTALELTEDIERFLADERVTGAVLINAPQYKEEPSSELLANIAQRQESHYYWRVALFNKNSWLKLLRGAEYRSIFRALSSKIRDKFVPRKPTTAHVPADVSAFEELTARDVRLMLLFSDADWGWDYLHAIMGHQIQEWAKVGNPRLETVKRADHMMTPLASQDRTRNLVLDWASRLPTREEFVL